MSAKIFFYINKPEILPVDITYDNISNIDNYADNSIENIMLNDLLDFYIQDISEQVLRLVSNKLKIHGNIEIQGIDLNELAISIANSQIDIETAKALLYQNGRKSIHNLYGIEIILKNLGYSIDQKKYINLFEYYISAKKNEK